MNPLKVLIADDEDDILEVMIKKIGASGYQVIAARDGLDAWQKIQAEEPDIIVLDLNMPGLHGFEVLKNIRGQENPPKWQPVVIVSAQTELEDIKMGYHLDADHYLAKPCNMEDVIKAIKLMETLIPQRTDKESKGK